MLLSKSLSTAVLLLTVSFAADSEWGELEREFGRAVLTERRIEILDQLGALYVEGEPDATDITQAVASGLKDDDLKVRAAAATRLGNGMDPEIAARALERAGADFAKVHKTYMKEYEPLNETLTDFGNLESGDLDIESIEDFSSVLEKLTQLLEPYAKYRSALAEALGNRRDPRCEEGLLDMLKVLGAGPESDDILDALLSFGSSKSLLGIVDSLGDHHDAIKQADKELRIARKAKPARKPKSWGRTKEAWAQEERKRIESELQTQQEKRDALESWGAELRSKLAQLAEAHSLPTPPETLESDRQWKNWVRGTAGLLPATVDAAPPAQNE